MKITIMCVDEEKGFLSKEEVTSFEKASEVLGRMERYLEREKKEEDNIINENN